VNVLHLVPLERRRGGKPAANWAIVRAEYVSGDESFSDIAKRLRVTPRAVEKHALNRSENGGRTWGALRSLHRNDQAARAIASAGATHAAKIQALVERQTDMGILALDIMRERLIDRKNVSDQNIRFCIRYAYDPRWRVTVPERDLPDIDLTASLPVDPDVHRAFDDFLKAVARAKPHPNALRQVEADRVVADGDRRE
jgi:hypothetical protein